MGWKDIKEQQSLLKSLETNQKVKAFHYRAAWDMALVALRGYVLKIQDNPRIREKMKQLNIKAVDKVRSPPLATP